MSWVSLGFMTLYLQLLGFSDMTTAMLVALFSLGAALGSLGGGYIGELAISLCFGKICFFTAACRGTFSCRQEMHQELAPILADLTVVCCRQVMC